VVPKKIHTHPDKNIHTHNILKRARQKPGVSGGISTQNTLDERGMDIFWNNTINELFQCHTSSNSQTINNIQFA